jgi:hypothetical protein
MENVQFAFMGLVAVVIVLTLAGSDSCFQKNPEKKMVRAATLSG